MLEAVKAALEFGFDKLGLNKISAKALVDNNSSNILLERTGFRKVGILRKDKIINRKAKDQVLWEIAKKE